MESGIGTRRPMRRGRISPRGIGRCALAIGLLFASVACCADIEPGKAVSITSQSGEWDSGDRFCPSVMRDESGYLMFYSGGARAEMSEVSTWAPCNIGLAKSKDGVGWTYRSETREPVLYSTPFREGDVLDPDTLAKRFDSVFAVGACAIRDGGVYKMWYTGWAGEQEHLGRGLTNKINYRVGYATSPDGVTWTKRPGKAGAGSVLGLGEPGKPDSKSAGQPWVLKDGPGGSSASPPYQGGAGGGYRMWYEGYDGKTWRICSAESKDGITWTKRGAVLEPGERGASDGLGARYPVVVKRGGQYELWYQGKSASEPACHVLRATSPDGVKWTKLSGEIDLLAGTPLGPGEGLYVDSVIVEPDGSSRVFFARESTTTRGVAPNIVQNKRWAMYTEVVKP